jgi:hypothetical protein
LKSPQRLHGNTAPGRPSENTCAKSCTSDLPIEPAKRSVEIAAELTGTNREYVTKAKQILKQDPELFKRIQSP